MASERSPDRNVVPFPRATTPSTPKPPADEKREERSDGLHERIQSSERIADSERLKAPVLYAELLAQPAGRRAILARNSDRYASYLLAEMVLEAGRQAWYGEAERAVEMGELAVAISEQLDEDFYGAGLARSLQAKSWAYLGNGLRIRGSHSAAEDAFHRAEVLLEGAHDDPLNEVEVLSLKASLASAQRRWESAIALLDRVIPLCREAGDEYQLGRLLIQKASAYGNAGNLEAAIELLHQGLGRIEVWREPRVVMVALLNLALCLVESGKPDASLTTLGRARPIAERLGDKTALIHMRWLEAQVLERLGRIDEAEIMQIEVRDAFIDRGQGWEATVATMDLATLYARNDRLEALRGLADMVPRILETCDLDHESRAALLLFRRAAERDLATVGLLAELLALLKGLHDKIPQIQEDST